MNLFGFSFPYCLYALEQGLADVGRLLEAVPRSGAAGPRRSAEVTYRRRIQEGSTTQCCCTGSWSANLATDRPCSNRVEELASGPTAANPLAWAIQYAQGSEHRQPLSKDVGSTGPFAIVVLETGFLCRGGQTTRCVCYASRGYRSSEKRAAPSSQNRSRELRHSY